MCEGPRPLLQVLRAKPLHRLHRPPRKEKDVVWTLRSGLLRPRRVKELLGGPLAIAPIITATGVRPSGMTGVHVGSTSCATYVAGASERAQVGLPRLSLCYINLSLQWHWLCSINVFIALFTATFVADVLYIPVAGDWLVCSPLLHRKHDPGEVPAAGDVKRSRLGAVVG